MNRMITFAPAAALLAGVLLVSGVREQYKMPPAKPLTALPAVLDGQPSVALVVPKDEQQVAGMSDYSLRAFGADTASPAFTLYVGYYDRQVQGKTIHSPKNCLPGAGWEIMQSTQIPAPGNTAGTVNRVLLANAGVRALVYYWYQGRGRVASSEYQVKWDLLRDAALYGRTEEALVRIVVPISRTDSKSMPTADDAEVQAADAMARRVAEQVLPEITTVMPPLAQR